MFCRVNIPDNSIWLLSCYLFGQQFPHLWRTTSRLWGFLDIFCDGLPGTECRAARHVAWTRMCPHASSGTKKCILKSMDSFLPCIFTDQHFITRDVMVPSVLCLTDNDSSVSLCNIGVLGKRCTFLSCGRAERREVETTVAIGAHYPSLTWI